LASLLSERRTSKWWVGRPAAEAVDQAAGWPDVVVMDNDALINGTAYAEINSALRRG
jgi:hypothetical protein